METQKAAIAVFSQDGCRWMSYPKYARLPLGYGAGQSIIDATEAQCAGLVLARAVFICM